MLDERRAGNLQGSSDFGRRSPIVFLRPMAIAGYAVGDPASFVYMKRRVRTFHPSDKPRIQQAKAMDCLGEDIFGSGFSFDVEV